MSRTIKLVASILFFTLAIPSLGFALLMMMMTVLGGIGILADVSQDENQAMAREAAVYLAISYAAGLALLAGGILTLRSYRKHPKPSQP